jgi:hypothetical protein
MERWRDNQYDDCQQQDVTGVNSDYDLYGAVTELQRLRGRGIGACHNYGKSVADGYGISQSDLLRPDSGVIRHAGRGDDHADDLYVEHWGYEQYDDRQQQDVAGFDGDYDLYGAVTELQRLRRRSIGACHHYGKPVACDTAGDSGFLLLWVSRAVAGGAAKRRDDSVV